MGIGYLLDGVGAALYYDIGYRIKDNVLMGYKGEVAFASNNTINSKTIFYHYYFNTPRKLRPFAGMGLGIYTPTGTNMAGGRSPGPGFSEMIPPTFKPRLASPRE